MKFRKRFFKHAIFFFLLVFTIRISDAQRKTNPSNALQHYLHNGDTTFHWFIKDSFALKGIKGYDILLVSQHWRQFTWKHQLTILCPEKNKYDDALVFITSGHNDTATLKPHWRGHDGFLMKQMTQIASKNKAIVSIIHQIPNEPLYGGLKEDRLISYTLHQYQEDTADYTWPLLFPMVKGVVKAMDVVQDFSKNKLHHPVKKFVLSGASKRGWTTWLTGANDDRVTGIVPMAIDVLNMPVNLAHQMKAYGGFSIAIHDYVRLGIVQGLSSPSGKALVKMIDPFSYRKKLAMPKMVCVGTNDPYWVIDNMKNYLPGIPGKNLIYYLPNDKHLIEDDSASYNNLSAFLGITLAHGKYPQCSWVIKEHKKEVSVSIKATKNILKGAKVWYAHSKDMDFRNNKFHSKDLHISHQSGFKVTEEFPQSGYRVFYVALTYENPGGGEYVVCTRAFMMDKEHVFK